MRKICDNNDSDSIKYILEFILSELVSSHKIASRSVGLQSLLAMSIALDPDKIKPYLELMVSGAVVGAFTNLAPIRILACETLYNITKVCRKDIFEYSQYIIEILYQLYSDPYVEVVKAAKILNGLVCDIFVEFCMSRDTEVILNDEIKKDKKPYQKNDGDDAYINLEKSINVFIKGRVITYTNIVNIFLKLIEERMTTTMDGSRIFLIEWLELFYSMPNFDFVPSIPTFLSYLFSFLIEENSEVKFAAQRLLDILLGEIIYRYSHIVASSSEKLYFSNDLGKENRNRM